VVEYTVKLNSDLERKLKVIALRKGLTPEQAAGEMTERGIEDYIYRMGRNQRVAQQNKADRVRAKAMEAKLEELGIDVDEL
jgi:hypothetical protein